jgi:glycosyltransferase involved in cell wall biosynthesis
MRSSAAPRRFAARASILAVTSEQPWPLDSGGHLRSFHLLTALARHYHVRLVTTALPDAAGINALRRYGVAVRTVTAPARSWPGEAYRAAVSAVRRRPYVLYSRHDHAAVRRAIREEARKIPPDLLYLDHLDSFAFASEIALVPTVVDLHNVYSTLLQRTADESYRGPLRWYLTREARLLDLIERRASATATTLLASSQADCDHFSGLGAQAVRLVPNGVDCDVYRRLPAGRSGGPPVILYVGTMSWEPNAKAAIFLAEHVLPQIRAEFPDCRLRIVGRDPTPQVQALTALPGVEVAGRVPEMVPHLAEAHALAVPLEAGGGTRLKILEAFAAGLPVVSTPIGCEGIAATSGTHLIVADRAAFAEGVCALLRNPPLSIHLATHARALALARYDWRAVGAAACDAAANALERKDERRFDS